MIQTTILKNLLENDTYTRKVIPFLKKEYFEGHSKVIFDLILNYVAKYNKLPTPEILKIEAENISMGDQLYRSTLESIAEIEKETQKVDDTWLLDNTEKWCQDRAIYLAIMKSIQIIDGKDDNLSKNALPELLSDALSVAFDRNIGHDYIENSDSRFDFYHRVEERIPFDLDFFNTITKGGLPKKTLNIILAGTGVGKSLFMCHQAAACLNMGKSVLYITMKWQKNVLLNVSMPT